MLRIYCKTCGSPNMYTLEKPKFCQGCGKALGAVTSHKKNRQNKRKETLVEELEDEEVYEEEELETIPDISELQIEIQAKGPSTHTFGQLGEDEHSVYDIDQSLPRDERSTSEIVEEFKKEAGFKASSKTSPKKSPPRKTTARGKPRGRPRGSKNKKK